MGDAEPKAPPVKCNTCKFYDTSVPNLPSGFGWCRGSAPMAAASVTTSQEVRWGLVAGNVDWCKEYLANSATWP